MKVLVPHQLRNIHPGWQSTGSTHTLGVSGREHVQCKEF
jgi:hypothetical protein